jgi:hypothetical protein
VGEAEGNKLVGVGLRESDRGGRVTGTVKLGREVCCMIEIGRV